MGSISKREAAAFGLKKKQAKRLQEWVRSRMAVVVGADARGGSGVVLELKDGTLAVLTARHVVVRAVSTGEVSVAFCGQAPSESMTPLAIRIHRRKDIAVVFLRPEQRPPAHIPYGEWSRIHDFPPTGGCVVCSGAPGEWKEGFDPGKRVVAKTKILHYFTAVTSDKHEGLVGCDVDESAKELPSHFGGMSGGPVFSVARQLLGLNIAQQRRRGGSSTGRIFVLPMRAASDIFDTAPVLAGPHDDYMGQREYFGFQVQPERGSAFGVLAEAMYCWSITRADEPHGRIGILEKLVVGQPGGGVPIAVSSRFEYLSADQKERLNLLAHEILMVLGGEDKFSRVTKP